MMTRSVDLLDPHALSWSMMRRAREAPPSDEGRVAPPVESLAPAQRRAQGRTRKRPTPQLKSHQSASARPGAR